MKAVKRIKIAIGLLWEALVSFISPFWIGDTYMNLTGHGKGYGYDMGDEADIAVMFGVIMVMLWIAAVVPVMIWLCKRFHQKKKSLVWVPVVVFLAGFAAGFYWIGLDGFLLFFGI